MKSSEGFDARRLRNRERKNWRLRLGVLLGVLMLLAGVLLALVGALVLLGQGAALGEFGAERDGGIVMLVAGLLLAWVGRLCWRRCRRIQRQPNRLSMSPHLMKKRN
ncbi:hypothetical protein [Stutzerimonas tarimensis]|uniref:LPXTG cell wall anchor domain-containing protein n=1 Tax=Stutzerimonas tarimensis TaxID=1507735 RepID=A0ABV7T8S6_9GAMM